MKKRIFFIIAIIVLVGGRGFAQVIAPQDMEKLGIMEDSMVITADSMYHTYLPDTRVVYSERFVRQLIHALKIPNSWAYPFEKVGKMINIIPADDTSFRIFNWEITPSEITKRYYGAIQLPGTQLRLIGLNDYAGQIEKDAEDSILTGGKWFGALYYRIMAVEVEGRKLYTLFGYSAASPVVDRKVLDVLTIDNGHATFGAPIFGVASRSNPRQRINRFLLEYKKGVQASMNWSEEKKAIVFDKLVSQMNDPHRKYTLVPSGQYDGFRWGRDTWNYVQDLIPVNELQDGQAPDEPTKQQ